MRTPAYGQYYGATAPDHGLSALTDQQVAPFALEPGPFAELISKDLEKWAKVVKTAGIRMD